MRYDTVILLICRCQLSNLLKNTCHYITTLPFVILVTRNTFAKDSPFYRELVKAFGKSFHDVSKYLKKLSKCANTFAGDARRLMDSWHELGYATHTSIIRSKIKSFFSCFNFI